MTFYPLLCSTGCKYWACSYSPLVQLSGVLHRCLISTFWVPVNLLFQWPGKHLIPCLKFKQILLRGLERIIPLKIMFPPHPVSKEPSTTSTYILTTTLEGSSRWKWVTSELHNQGSFITNNFTIHFLPREPTGLCHYFITVIKSVKVCGIFSLNTWNNTTKKNHTPLARTSLMSKLAQIDVHTWSLVLWIQCWS